MELRGLGDVHQEMVKRGGTVLALSVDPPGDSKRVAQTNGLTFPVLCDVDRSMIQAYGLVHPGGGPDGSDIARPATMLVDGAGTILWRRVSTRVQDRPGPEDLLARIRQLL